MYLTSHPAASTSVGDPSSSACRPPPQSIRIAHAVAAESGIQNLVRQIGYRLLVTYEYRIEQQEQKQWLLFLLIGEREAVPRVS